MRKWARNTGRAALVAAGAAVALGSAGTAGAALTPVDAGALHGAARHGGGDVDLTSVGNVGAGNGNQVYAPISLPIDVCGNAIAIVGTSQAQCEGGASVESGDSHYGYRSAGDRSHGNGYGDGADLTSAGNVGAGNGNQVYAPIDAPISVCGNSISLFGTAQAQCKGGASVERGGGSAPDLTSAGNVGLLNGNQAYAPIDAPISLCGTAIGAGGPAAAQCKGGAKVVEKNPLPPTLRTPPKKHKVYKPSGTRPAAGKKPLPSTQRGSAYRTTGVRPDYRNADAMPAVKNLLDSLKRSVPSLSGVQVEPGQVGPQLPMGDAMPVEVGGPSLG